MAFVLTGGAAAGAAQVGMLRALLGAGIQPDLLVGCSVGALNAVYVAVDPRPTRVTELARIWASLGAADVFGGTRRSRLGHLLRGDAHLYEPDALRALVARTLTLTDLAATVVPVEVVTTDLGAGCSRWWRSGDPVDVLVASASLPGLFPPVELDGGLHVDGGVLANTPVARALDLGAGTVYVLDASPRDRPPAPGQPLRALDVVLTSFAIARRVAEGDAMASACPHQTVVHLPVPPVAPTDPRDFSRTAELIAAGHSSASAVLAKGLVAGVTGRVAGRCRTVACAG